MSLGPLLLPGEPLPDARKLCALGANVLINFLILCIKVQSSLPLLSRLVPRNQRAPYAHNVTSLRQFRLPNWYVQFLILIVTTAYQDSSKRCQSMRKVSQNQVRDLTPHCGKGTNDLGNGFTKTCGRFARDNGLLDTNWASVYAGMTCRKRERADRSANKIGLGCSALTLVFHGSG